MLNILLYSEIKMTINWINFFCWNLEFWNFCIDKITGCCWIRINSIQFTDTVAGIDLKHLADFQSVNGEGKNVNFLVVFIIFFK